MEIRKKQRKPSFFHEWDFPDYNIEAPLEDCYLLPKHNRNFKIQKSDFKEFSLKNRERNILYAGTFTTECSIVSKAFEYIINYCGDYEVINSYDEIIISTADNRNYDDYDKLLNIGIKYYDEENFEEAIKYFNSARLIKETLELEIYRIDTLYNFKLFDKTIRNYINIIRKYSSNIYIIDRLIKAVDSTGDYDFVIKLIEGLLTAENNSKEIKKFKLQYLLNLFKIHLYYKNEDKCNELLDRLEEYAKEIDSKEIEGYIKNLELLLFEQPEIIF